MASQFFDPPIPVSGGGAGGQEQWSQPQYNPDDQPVTSSSSSWPDKPTISIVGITPFATASDPILGTVAAAPSSQDGSGSGSNNKKTIAIAVPVSVVGAVILGALIFFLIRRRRRQQQQQQRVLSSPDDPMAQPASGTALLPQTEAHWNSHIHDRIPIHPIPRRPVPSPRYQVTTESAPPAPQSSSASRSRTSVTGNHLMMRRSESRPRSPFEDPRDDHDAVSEVSDLDRDRDRDRPVDGGLGGRNVHDDDVSSVSSFGESDDGDRGPGMKK